MKPLPYLKQCLKELDGVFRDLRKLPKEEKTKYLTHYQYGLEDGFYTSSPKNFTNPIEELGVIESSARGFYGRGCRLSMQFGPWEVESAREFLLAEFEKRKAKFSKKPFLLSRFFWEKLRGRKENETNTLS